MASAYSYTRFKTWGPQGLDETRKNLSMLFRFLPLKFPWLGSAVYFWRRRPDMLPLLVTDLLVRDEERMAHNSLFLSTTLWDDWPANWGLREYP